MNLLERELHYPLGDTLPAPGETLEVAPGVRWIRMALPFALDHINLWLLRDRSTAARAGRWSTAAFRMTMRGAVGADLRDPAAGPADPARDRDAHAPRPHRPGRLAVPSAGTRRCGSAPPTTTWRGSPRRAPLARRRRAADFFASHGLADPESIAKIRARTNYYANMVPSVPAQFRAHARRRPRPHRRPRLALHQRLRPRARTHRAVLRGAQRAARRRHDAAAHLDQRERACRGAGGQLAAAVPRQHRELQAAAGRTRWGCLRTASPSAACTRASGSCRSTTATAWPNCWRPARQAAAAAADVLPILFKRELDLHQTTFAMGETVAHLHALWYAGQLRRAGTRRRLRLRAAEQVLAPQGSAAALAVLSCNEVSLPPLRSSPGRDRLVLQLAAELRRSRVPPCARFPRSAGCGP